MMNPTDMQKVEEKWKMKLDDIIQTHMPLDILTNCVTNQRVLYDRVENLIITLQTQHEAEIAELDVLENKILTDMRPGFVSDEQAFATCRNIVRALFSNTSKRQVKENDMYDGDTFDISDVEREHQNVGRWKGEMKDNHKTKDT